MQRALAVVLLAAAVWPTPALLAIVFIHASDRHTLVPAYQIALVMYVVVLVIGKQAVSDNGVLTSVPCHSWGYRHIHSVIQPAPYIHMRMCIVLIVWQEWCELGTASMLLLLRLNAIVVLGHSTYVCFLVFGV